MLDSCEMIDRLQVICAKCTKCELGRAKVSNNFQEIDPHFPGWRDGMSPLARVMLVGSAPSLNDINDRQVFAGEIGKEFDKILDQRGGQYRIDRNSFYITNIIKCHAKKPTMENVVACSTYLRAELSIIKPLLVITLGALAFKTFCPDLDPIKLLGRITKSEQFGVKVYPTYHPISLTDSITRLQFGRHIGLICDLLFKIDCPF